jgi:hypothetical protein
VAQLSRRLRSELEPVMNFQARFDACDKLRVWNVELIRVM